MAYPSILVLFWFIFFLPFFKNPFRYATGGFLEDHFGYFTYMGRCIREGRSWLKDDYFYYEPGGIPFTCAWYPPYIIAAYIASFFKLNIAFIIFATFSFSHYLIGSLFAYALFSQWGSPELALMATLVLCYNQKVCTYIPSFHITWGLIPVVLYFMSIKSYFGASIASYFLLTAGYLPMIIYVAPLMIFCGIQYVLPVIPFCIPFLLYVWNYYKRTVRMGSTYEYKAMGSISPLNLIRGFITYPMQNLGGIQHNEAAFGIGRVAIIVLILSITNKGVTLFECLFLISLYLMMGKYVKAPILFRCPVKWAYLMTVSAAFIIAHMSIHIPLALVLIQMLDILLNHRRLLLDNSQWAVWPEQVYSSPLVRYLEENVNGHKVSGLPFPLRSGYITGIRGIGYLGGSSTKERAKLFGTGGEGSPCHDWFYMKEDGNCLNRYGIKFAYRPMKKLNPWKWSKTPIRGLWLNRFLIPHN